MFFPPDTASAISKLQATAPAPKPAPKPAAKSVKPTKKAAKVLSPQEKIRAAYEKDTKDLSSLGNKGKVTATKISGAPLDMSGVDAIKNMALTPSQESAWLKLANDQQRLDEANNLETAGRNAATSADQAKASLAMSGGLRSGAAERLAGASADANLLARQGIYNQGAVTRAGLGINAEENRLKALSALPTAQMGVANYGTDIEKYNATNNNIANATNVTNRINDLANRNSMVANMYNTDMQQWAAGQQADALEKSKPPTLQDQFMSNPLGRVVAGVGTAGVSEFGKGGALSSVGKVVSGGGK